MVGGFLYGEFRMETLRWQVPIVDIANKKIAVSNNPIASASRLLEAAIVLVKSH